MPQLSPRASARALRNLGSKQSEGQSGSSLICRNALSPPPKQIGHGDSSITYIESQPAWQCAFSPDGVYLAACYGSPDPCIRLWRQESGGGNKGVHLSDDDTPIWILESTLRSQERTIRSVAFAPVHSPRILAAASFDGSVVIWEQQTTMKDWDCTAQLEGHDNEVKCVTWNSTGSLLATCGRDKTVWVWECFLPGTVGGPSPSGVGGGGGDFECLAVLNGHEGDVKCVRFAPSHGQWGDGDEILFSSSYDDSIKLWAEDAGDWYCAASISGVHSGTIWSLAVAPSGVRLVSGSEDGNLAIYKCYTALEKKEYFPSEENGAAIGSGLCKCVGVLSKAHTATVYCVDYAPAKSGHCRIASGGADNYIRIYREARGSVSHQPQFLLDAEVQALHGDVNCVCWHPWDGSVLVSAGDDGVVRVWSFTTSR
jgi:cytosolic iron-sulfur protein assembly protein CIAO1